MQTAANSNLFVKGFSSFSQFRFTQVEIKQEGFYQQLASELARSVHGKQVFEELAQRLIVVADRAYAMRRMETVEHVCHVLMNLPMSHRYESIWQYYAGLCLVRQKQFDNARKLFEYVVEKAPAQHRTKAIMSLGSVYFYNGDFQTALPIYIEAGKCAVSGNVLDPFAALTTNRMIAVLKSIDGNHRGALDDLEKLFPLAASVSRWNGPLFCDFLNSYSVELTEVGRLEEAANVMRLVLASPYANAYPEWRETGEEIERRGYRLPRSKVVFTKQIPEPDNLLFLPERAEESDSTHNPFQQSAIVFNFHKWKNKMGKKSNGDSKDKPGSEDRRNMSTSQRLVRILSSIDSEMTDEELDSIIDLIDEIKARRKDES